MRRYSYQLGQRWFLNAIRRVGLEPFGGHMILPSKLGADSVLLDLGANRGEFYQTVFLRFGCRCVAVEAAPDLFERLPQVPGLLKHNVAVSSQTQARMLALSENPQANSLNVQVAKAYGVRGWIQVRGITLRDLLLEVGYDWIDLLKVDIEGAEIEMFNSTDEQSLLRCGQIAVEFHDFILAEDRSGVASVLGRMRRIGFIVLVLSSEDCRQVLMLNRRRLNLGVTELWEIYRLLAVIRLRRVRARLSRAIRGA